MHPGVISRVSVGLIMWTGGPYRPFLRDRHFRAAASFQIGVSRGLGTRWRPFVLNENSAIGSGNQHFPPRSTPAKSQNSKDGRVAEWFKAPVLKTGVPARVPWVRIPPLPPVPMQLQWLPLDGCYGDLLQRAHGRRVTSPTA